MTARGYLGKISAVVSVNASSVAPTLNSTAREINAWAKRTQSSISSATTSVNKSFNGMFTSLQRVQRALADSRQLDIRVKGQENLLALRAVAESLAKPLGDSARQLEKLGQSVELAFRPSLEAVQTAVESVRDRISRGVSVSQRELQSLLADVRQVSVAINAASEARSLAGNLTRGDTLRFADPRQFDALNRASSIQRRVESLPAVTTAGFGIGRQQAEVRRQIDLLEQLRVKQDAARLAGGDTSQADAAVIQQTARVEAAVAAYDRLTEAAEKYNAASKQPAPAPTGLDFGLALDDPKRQIEAIRGSIVSLGTQLDRLPASVRTQFIPALQAAQNRLQALANNPRATAEEIENAANEVDRLGQQLRRVSQVQSIPNFAESLNETSLRGALGNLGALQQILSRIGATAGSELGQAFDRMRAIIQRATIEGTIGTQAFENELRDAAREAANLAAQTNRISAEGAFREIQRGGDVARGGFDKISLAAQQAAFAIDDFFSVQGDFSQRIRAVQNNLTQLAFILGGTRGLFIGIAAAITAQATVALVKWFNGGRSAEDQTKALNDALARQKSLVEELAQSFESLADTIARRTFSQSQQEARDFERQLEAIAKKQNDLREQSLLSRDEEAFTARASVNAAQNRLNSSTSLDGSITAQRELEQAQRRLREAERAAMNRPPPTGEDALAAVIRAVERRSLSSAQAAARSEDEPAGRRAAVQREIAIGERRVAELRRAGAPQDALGAIEFLNQQIREFERQGSDEGINALESLIGALEDPARRTVNELALEIIRGTKPAVEDIASAQEEVAEAVRAGIPGARELQERLGVFAQELQNTINDVSDTGQKAGSGRITAQEAQRRNEQNRQLFGLFEVQRAALTAERNRVRVQAEAIRSVESFAQALDRAAGQVADSALRDAEGRAQQARRNANELFARAFSPDALGVRDEDRVQRARQADSTARRAEDDFEAAQERNRIFAAQRGSAIQGFSRQAAAGTLGRDLQDAISQLSQARRDAESTILAPDQREAAAQLAQTLERQLSEAFERTPAARRLAQQANTADVANQINAQLDRDREQFNQSVSRGRDFLISPQQRQSQELQQQLDDATNAALQGFIEPLRGGIFPQRAQAEVDAIRSVIDDEIITLAEIGQLFQKFPGIRDELRGPVEQAIAQLEGVRGNIEDNGIAAQLAENRANAALQGPSRAALSASDITTGEGQRELNRLLRGDDPARDVNLEEARKQSTKLDQVNEHLEKLRQIFAGVAD